jgi:membrane protein DedA with SNARE-associated domain
MPISDALLDVEALGALGQVITTAVERLGYPGIFIGMVLSSTPLPIPSEVIMPFAGYIVWKGGLTLIGVTLVGTLGCLAGSLVDYAIGVYGGRPFLERYGKYLLIHASRLDDMAHDLAHTVIVQCLSASCFRLVAYISLFWLVSSG